MVKSIKKSMRQLKISHQKGSNNKKESQFSQRIKRKIKINQKKIMHILYTTLKITQQFYYIQENQKTQIINNKSSNKLIEKKQDFPIIKIKIIKHKNILQQIHNFQYIYNFLPVDRLMAATLPYFWMSGIHYIVKLLGFSITSLNCMSLHIYKILQCQYQQSQLYYKQSQRYYLIQLTFVIISCRFAIYIYQFNNYRLSLLERYNNNNNTMSQIQIFRKYVKEDYRNLIPKLKYKTNFTNCILKNFQNRKYQKTQNDDWDIIWSQKQFIPQIYEKKLLPHQRVNHFKNYQQLCKKDLLVRNLKKHRKQLQRQGNVTQAKQYFYDNNFRYYFFPQTFVLPSQYFLFADQFKKSINIQNPNWNVWIMKPTGKSQGKGIFLVNKLSQTSSWETSNNIGSGTNAEPYIIQKYINDPLLIGGKKFDIRLYVLVTSYNPLTVYLYRGGFARFTHSRYDQSKINDVEAHLTNVAIQKLSENYDENIGGKWYLDKLKTFIQSKYGYTETQTCFFKIQNLIIKTLEAMTKVMTNGNSQKQNSFQLYGFDILLDKNLNSWLIEVNGSPSMTANTNNDYQLKMGLLDDTLAVLNIQKLIFDKEKDDQIGGFDLISNKKIGTNKNGKSSQNMNLKMSFLGCMINREQNYKKLAKVNSNYMNAQFQALFKQKQVLKEKQRQKREQKQRQRQKQKQKQKQRQKQKQTQTDNRNSMSNRPSYQKKVMGQSNKQTSTPNSLGQKNLSRSRKQVPTSPGISIGVRHQSQGNDFAIKKKIMRQVTNQNQPKQR